MRLAREREGEDDESEMSIVMDQEGKKYKEKDVFPQECDEEQLNCGAAVAKQFSEQ